MRTYQMLLGLPISDISPEEACFLAENRRKKSVSVWLLADAALVLRACKREEVLAACLGCERIFAEGQAIRVAAARMGRAFTEKSFSAVDLISMLMASGQQRYFFVGGSRGVARRAAVSTAMRAGRTPCPVVGGVRGDFCRKGRENAAVLTRIWECQPDFVLLCMEDAVTWFGENRSKLPPALYILAPEGTMERLAGCEADQTPFAGWRAFWCQEQLKRHAKRRMLG